MSSRLTLVVRAYCHLCDDMRAALGVHARGVAVEEIDVDTDPTLEVRWGGKVPVLLGDGRELCHFQLDVRVLQSYLARPSGSGSR
ncbi:MAG TPA: glutaredoxin family protein [Casimicrobiaceae bacterium]